MGRQGGLYSIVKIPRSLLSLQKECKLKQSLETIRRKLPSQLFVQCHRSYLVNLMYIRHITSGSITMANGEVIQLGRVYQSQLMKLFRQFYLEGSHEEC